MANEKLQKLGYGSTREAITGASSVELREPVINTQEALNQEIVIKYDPGSGEQEFHWPSEERLAIGITPPSDGDIDSGSQIISVKGTFANLPEANGTSKTLLAVLTEIDDKLGSGLSTILNDGTRPMLSDWDCLQDVNVGNANRTKSNVDGLGVFGDEVVMDKSTIASWGPSGEDIFLTPLTGWVGDSTTTTNISGAIEYAPTGVYTSGYATYNIDTRVDGKDTVFHASTWYQFQYNIDTNTGGGTMSFSSEFADGTGYVIDTTVGDNKTVLVKTKWAENLTELIDTCKLNFVGAEGTVIRISNMSIKKFYGGSIDCNSLHSENAIVVNGPGYKNYDEADAGSDKRILEIRNPNWNASGWGPPTETNLWGYISCGSIPDVTFKSYGDLNLLSSGVGYLTAGDNLFLRSNTGKVQINSNETIDIVSQQGLNLYNSDTFTINASNDPYGLFTVKGQSVDLITTNNSEDSTRINGILGTYNTVELDSFSVTLDSSHQYVNVIEWDSDPSSVLTIPAAVATNKGKVYYIKNETGGFLDTITPTGTDRIGSDSFAGNAISIADNVTLMIVSNGAGVWVVFGGAYSQVS